MTPGRRQTADTPERKRSRERQFSSAKDFELSSSQLGEVEPFSDQLKRKAQYVIAGNAKGRSRKAQVADAEMIMKMLGVHPTQSSDDLVAPLVPIQNHKSFR